MDEKVKAIVIRSVDYQENDKLLWLYSVEHGKFCAVIKGVKKARAQLKFAAEPFCFGEYTLASSRGRRVVTGCVALTSFYELRTDLSAFYAACAIVDTLATLEGEEEPNPPLFIATLKHLGALLTPETDCKLVALKYLLTYMEYAGYGLHFDKCGVCKSIASGKMYLDAIASGVVCVSCRTQASLPLQPAVVTTLRLTCDTDADSLGRLTFKDEYLRQALSALNAYITHTLTKVKALASLIDS